MGDRGSLGCAALAQGFIVPSFQDFRAWRVCAGYAMARSGVTLSAITPRTLFPVRDEF